MKRPCSHASLGSAAGFTLVELVLALGIFSFALVGVLGLFPIALKNASDSRSQTFITAASRNLVEQIKTSLREKTATIQKLNTEERETVMSLDLSVASTRYLTLDQYGNPLRELTPEQYELGDQEAGFLVRIQIIPLTAAMVQQIPNFPDPKSSQVTITLESPGAAPAANRSKEWFVMGVKLRYD